MTKKRVPGDERLDLLNDPLDYQILRTLPPEGTLAFGAYQTGKTALEVRKDVGDGTIGTMVLSARIRVMAELGLLVKHKGLGTGGKYVWQITPKGQSLLQTWEASND